MKTTAALVVPLVTGAAVISVGMAELTPVSASAATTSTPTSSPSSDGLLSSLLAPLTGTSTPSTKKTKTSSTTGLVPSIVNSLLPGTQKSPSQPSQPSDPLAGLLPAPQAPAPAKGTKHSKPAPKPNPAYVPEKPTLAPGSLTTDATSTPGTPTLARDPSGYSLPVSRSVIAAHPSIIGEGSEPPSTTQSAQAVTLGVPAGTAVNAVTAGTMKILSGSNGLSTVVLSGVDGVTYTYKNVAGATGSAVKPGQKIGETARGGLPFSITAPDVKGPLDADEALQAWDSGQAVNVRSLPSTVAPPAVPAKQHVFVVTDSAAKPVASSLTKALAGPLVQVTTATLSDSASSASIAKKVASAGKQIVIVALASGTPAEAASLAGQLHGGRQLLWVASPSATASDAAAYQAVTANHPGFRVESLPSSLTLPDSNPAQSILGAVPTVGQQNSASTASGRTAADELAMGTLTATYATNAYRLYAISSQANTVLSWAYLQLGKPYKWAAAGPTAFDCSGLTMDALQQAGVALTHNAAQQLKLTSAHKVNENQLQPGDLVFFTGSDGTANSPGHVGIYVGDGQIIDAPYTGTVVRFDPISSIQGYQGATDPFAPAAEPGGSAQALAQLAGLAVPASLTQYQNFAQALSNATWGSGQFSYLYELWERESGWNPSALNALSGAYGIAQALPAGKMSATGLDWATDPYTQMMWGISYIQSAYGTPEAAWAHEEADGWY